MRARFSRSDFTSAMISSLSFLYLRSCAGDSDSAFELELDVLVLQAAQPLVGVGDGVEGLDHLGLELGLDCGEREPILHVVVVEVAFAAAARSPSAVRRPAWWRRGRRPLLAAARRWSARRWPRPAGRRGQSTGAGMALASGPA